MTRPVKEWVGPKDTTPAPPRVKARIIARQEGICAVPGCERTARTRGWCDPHYKRWLRHGSPTAGRTPDGEPLTFLATAIENPPSGCVIWPFAKANGYGTVTVDGLTRYAHREALERFYGPAPAAGMVVAHAPGVCHRPSCINPLHLRWAKPVENEADKIIDSTDARGEKHGQAKLTADLVRTIRQSSRSSSSWAKELGVSRRTVSAARSGQTWSWISADEANK